MNVRGDALKFPHSTNTTALICKSRKENPHKLIQLSKPGGVMENMVIDDRLPFFGSLFISLSATQFLIQSINVVQPSNNNNDDCSFICWNQDVFSMKFLDT